jgi:hypothetical protein
VVPHTILHEIDRQNPSHTKYKDPAWSYLSRLGFQLPKYSLPNIGGCPREEHKQSAPKRNVEGKTCLSPAFSVSFQASNLMADVLDPSSDRDPLDLPTGTLLAHVPGKKSTSHAIDVWREGEALNPGHAGISRNR